MEKSPCALQTDMAKALSWMASWRQQGALRCPVPLAAPVPSAPQWRKQDHWQGPWLPSRAAEERARVSHAVPVMGDRAASAQPRDRNGVVRQLRGRKPSEIFLGASDEKVNYYY